MKTMKTMMLAAICTGALLGAWADGDDDGAAAAYEIGEASLEKEFWTADPVLFVKKHQEQGFKFTAEDRRSADSRRDGGVTCFGLPVYETRISFADGGGVERIELMLFNLGGTEKLEEFQTDGGGRIRHLSRSEKKISREEFFKLLDDVRAKLTPAKRKPPQPQKERTRDASVRQLVQTWPTSDISTRATLKWNYTQQGNRVGTFRPGYVRLSIDGPSKAGKSAGTKKSGGKGGSSIVDNVVRDPRGDVFVDNVPMVDQGMKGYCAVSAAERIMRYYGLEVDEHELAEAAGTSATRGTTAREMRDAVDRIARRHRLATKVLYGDFDDDVSLRIANLSKEVDNYNKVAKGMKKGEITEDMYVKHQGNMTTYDISAVDAAMDAEVLKEMKTKRAQKQKYVTFMRNVRQNVDAGVPIFWSVKLGIYPETDLPQAAGGHMRLIIGYNEKKDEILYTDTWGKGHELKRMPAGWAWTITKCVMVTKPH